MIILLWSVFNIGFVRSEKMIKQRDQNILQNYEGEIFLTGIVSEIPTNKQKSKEIIINVISINNEGKQIYPHHEKILVVNSLYPDYDYGDVLEIIGILDSPDQIGDFDYKSHLANKQIYGLIYRPKIKILRQNQGNVFLGLVSDLRLYLENQIKRSFPEPEASLLSGVVLGIKNDLPEEFDNNLRRTGTTHIVVVSGSNISFVFLFLSSLTVVIGKKQTLIISLFGTFFYVVLVGFDPPVMRSLLMVLPVISARLLGKEAQSINNLLLSASVMLLFNPFLITDLSFQLSFMATLGIIILYPILQEFFNIGVPLLKEIIFTSLSAQIMTWPITVTNFQEFSIISILVNIIVLPIVPILTYGGFLFLVCSLILKPILPLVGWVLYFPLVYLTSIVNWFGKMSWVSLQLESISPYFGYIYFGVLTLFVFLHKTLHKKEGINV